MEARNEIVPIEMKDFLARIIQMKMEKWRLVQICAVRIPDGYELSYSFSKNYDLINLRLTAGETEKVPSITQIYPCAFMVENETAELFGVQIEHIGVDYQDKLYRIAQEAPFKEKG